MITNYDLEKMAKSYNIELTGVYMKDQLDNLPINDGNYIINLDNEKGIGTHWTALHIRDKQAIYFDSFGCVPPLNVINFVKQRSKPKLGYNNFIIQDLKSDACGFHCIAFFLFLSQSKNKNIYKSTDDFIKMFEDDTLKNEATLKKIFKNI
jgi:hypothetical protein